MYCKYNHTIITFVDGRWKDVQSGANVHHAMPAIEVTFDLVDELLQCQKFIPEEYKMVNDLLRPFGLRSGFVASAWAPAMSNFVPVYNISAIDE